MQRVSLTIQDGWPKGLEVEPYGLFFDLVGKERVLLAIDDENEAQELVEIFATPNGNIYLYIESAVESIEIDGDRVYER